MEDRDKPQIVVVKTEAELRAEKAEAQYPKSVKAVKGIMFIIFLVIVGCLWVPFFQCSAGYLN